MEEKILKPGDLQGKRWVAHLHRALKVFLKDYKVIYGHFNNTVGAATTSIEMQGRAKTILKQQEKFKTVLFGGCLGLSLQAKFFISERCHHLNGCKRWS